MIRQFTILAIAGLGLGLIAPPRAAQAEEFRVVDSDARFVSLIEGRELRRLGIRLTVTPRARSRGAPLAGLSPGSGAGKTAISAATYSGTTPNWGITVNWCKKTARRSVSHPTKDRACSPI